MRLLSVIPIAKGARIETLSYYSKEDIALGALVRISLRKRRIPGLVVAARDIALEKATIKQAGFSLKKIDGVITNAFFPETFMRAAAHIAHLHATHEGAVLAALTPAALFEELPAKLLLNKGTAPLRADAPTVRVLQLESEHRHGHYKGMVRESFAKHQSVFFVVPSAHDAERLHTLLARGIEDHAFLMTSALTPKQTRTVWKKALETKHPVLIIGTYSFLALPRHDIGLYVLERESSSLYKMRERPHLDIRLATEEIARAFSADVVFGDTFLSIDTLARYGEHEIEDVMRPSMRQVYQSTFDIVDVRRVPDDDAKPQQMFSPHAHEALLRALRKRASCFVYVARRGFASITTCRDCGATLSCDRCDAPLVLHTRQNAEGAAERLFMCHRCNHRRGAQTVCDTCGSWRLEAWGYGIERVRGELTALFPETGCIEVSGDATTTPKRAEKALAEWLNTPGSILLGTEMALPYVMKHGVDTTVVVSIDSLVALPDFRMNERLFHLLSDMRTASHSACVVQTKSPEYAALGFVRDGDGAGLYRYEEKMRRDLAYPPWSIAVKISLRGERESVTKALEALAQTLAPRDTAVYPAFIATVKNVFEAHLLVTLKKEDWPDDRLLETLKNLPPMYDVDVNPLSFL